MIASTIPDTDPGNALRAQGAQDGPATDPAGQNDRLIFSGKDAFYSELRRRVNDFLHQAELPARGGLRMYVKAAVFLGAFAALYAVLVFVPGGWFVGLLLAMSLGAAAAAIGLNIMHDGGHGAFSRHAWVNQLAALTLEIVGGSSYIWHWKHGIYHHTYANIAGYDSDIDVGALGRMSPYQERHWYQRWQHWYMWFLYGLMAIRWHVYDDFRDLIRGRIGERPFPRPRGRDLLIFVGGKAFFFSLAFGVPALFHPLWVVVVYYAATSMVLGVLLSVVFQMAHCVEGTQFLAPAAGSSTLAVSWAIHQVESTRDFIRKGRIRSWFLGGLNFQIEHHLFPRISHVHYHRIARLVEDTCREFGVTYSEHRSILSGMRAHYRWLRRMGSAGSAGIFAQASAAE